MTDLLTRLKDWENVYPEDIGKTEGHLYEEAYDALAKAITKLEKIDAWVKGTGLYAHPEHLPVPVFRDLPELIKELKS
jgi:hypothetical protein